VKILQATFVCLLACLALATPALVPAQAYNQVILVPDGRQESDSIPLGATGQYVFAVQPGHSYSVEQSRGLNRPTLYMLAYDNCPLPSITDTSTMDPAVVVNNVGLQPQRQRVTIVCGGIPSPNSAQFFGEVQIQNSGGAGPVPYNFNITVKDTTLFSNKWKAAASTDTYWTFTNISSAPINVIFSVLDAQGNLLSRVGPIGVIPNTTYSVNTIQLPLPRTAPDGTPITLSGSVVATQDGPPGAIRAGAAIMTTEPGPCQGPCNTTTETVRFEPKVPTQ
jgi:hypothetical protein